jgi:SAM-dependent methyltransferase
MDVTQRFSTRVDNYTRYRPGYPPEVLDIITRRAGLTSGSRIADVGCGTGLLAQLFVAAGHEVWGVEPNGPMRQEAERQFTGHPHFHSVDGRSEATTLASAAVDLISAGQAAHWFDLDATRPEFARILVPGGWVALVWNTRQLGTTPFLRDYEALFQTYGTDYKEVVQPRGDEVHIRRFFAPHEVVLESVPSQQALDLEGLRGRVESASYCPEPASPLYGPMMAELQAMYDRYQVDGKVYLLYDTQVFMGQLH